MRSDASTSQTAWSPDGENYLCLSCSDRQRQQQHHEDSVLRQRLVISEEHRKRGMTEQKMLTEERDKERITAEFLKLQLDMQVGAPYVTLL